MWRRGLAATSKQKLGALSVLGAFAVGNTSTAYAKTERPHYQSILDRIRGKFRGSDFLDTSKWVANDHCLVKVAVNERKSELEKLRNAKTSQNWTLDKATICAQKRSQHVGVYAGDDESYDLFAPMFDHVIESYHDLDLKKNRAVQEDYGQKTLPKLPSDDSIKSTRIRTARNLVGFPFTSNMTGAQRKEIEAILKKVFDGFTDPRLVGKYESMTEMTEARRNELVDLHYLYINDDPTLELLGTYEDWPQGRGIFINDKKDDVGIFIVWVGEEDQMRIMAMNKGSDVQAIWDLFYAGVQAVHEGLKKDGYDFAFKESHGYLSSCPTNLGTGMRASVHVNLPAFAMKEDVKKFVKERGLKIDVRGTRGEATDTSGCTVYDISNKERLGSDCYEQITAMAGGVKLLLEECGK